MLVNLLRGKLTSAFLIFGSTRLNEVLANSSVAIHFFEKLCIMCTLHFKQVKKATSNPNNFAISSKTQISRRLIVNIDWSLKTHVHSTHSPRFTAKLCIIWSWLCQQHTPISMLIDRINQISISFHYYNVPERKKIPSNVSVRLSTQIHLECNSKVEQLQ